MKNVLRLHTFVAEKHPESLNVIQMILQLSECLSATNICEQNNCFYVQFYIYMYAK